MLDADLARLYGVETRALVQGMKRNRGRFPEDFVFQVTKEESSALRSQIVILKQSRGQHTKYLPYAFTEHGAVMLANVLKSSRAITASIQVVRAFVRLRAILATHVELAQKLKELEAKIGEHDESIRSIFEAIRQLMTLPEEERKPIGFHGALKRS